jgi:polyisoprenoid-binding protein YceI
MTTRSRWFLACLALVVALANAVPSGAEPMRFRILTEASELVFHATSRLVNADGRFTRFTGEAVVDPADLASALVSVTIDAASLDTGIRRRDDHLRSEDFFHVERFPTITFESTRVEGSGRRLVVVGRLTLRGITREVAVPLEVDVSGGKLEARGRLQINRGDYGIIYDSALNPIGQRVRIDFTFRAQAVR